MVRSSYLALDRKQSFFCTFYNYYILTKIVYMYYVVGTSTIINV